MKQQWILSKESVFYPNVWSIEISLDVIGNIFFVTSSHSLFVLVRITLSISIKPIESSQEVYVLSSKNWCFPIGIFHCFFRWIRYMMLAENLPSYGSHYFLVRVRLPWKAKWNWLIVFCRIKVMLWLIWAFHSWEFRSIIIMIVKHHWR